jgi:D-glycero-alpha-D-manno-heptose-7-phosphate kinase
MIITRTPFRISFFGGGTDYPAWYREHGGAVLATTIDKYCYISCRKLPPFFTHKHRIVYSKIENVNRLEDIEHPSARAVMRWMRVNDGLEIHHDGDLPARSGLGSSSAFTVGLLHALHALNGNMVSQEQLAREAIHIEQDEIGENVGSQDQVSAAHGGFNKIEFNADGSIDTIPVIIPKARKEELQDHLMFCFTGFSRIADTIAKSKIDNFMNRVNELTLMRQMVDDALGILSSETVPITDFGKLLHENWQYKRSLSDKVSTSEIDQIYDVAMKTGALGGKILGAGGGGFMLIFATPDRHKAIREALNKLVHVSFKFDDSGSKVVLYQPDGL